MPHARSVRSNLQNFSRLCEGKSFNVVQQEQLSLSWLELFEGRPHLTCELRLFSGSTGVRSVADELLHQLLHRRLRPVGYGFFAKNAAALGCQMATVKIDQSLSGNPPKPQVEGQRRVSGVIRQTSGGHKHRFLNDIRRINASSQPVVYPAFDHSFQPFPILSEEPTNSNLIASDGTGQQLVVIRALSGCGHQTWVPATGTQWQSEA